MKIKYEEGCFVGVNKDILLVKRVQQTPDKKRFVCDFKCPYCKKIFRADLYAVNKSYYSCGCWRKENVLFQKEDLTGKKFGKLTVLSDSGRRAFSRKTGEKANVIWNCVCECGAKTQVSSCHLKSGHTTSCGKCCISKGEDKIKSSLQSLQIRFEQQKRFTDCRDKHTLPFDFYLPDFNCCIEYDGKQHFYTSYNKKSTIFTPEKISDIQKKDKIKTNYCQKTGIKLLRVSYLDFDEISEPYLLEKLNTVVNNSFGSTGE